VDSGQKSADKHDQQVDLHGVLRCLIAATNRGNANDVPVKRDDSDVRDIKIGKFYGKPMEAV
jgi:hypothetical protein